MAGLFGFMRRHQMSGSMFSAAGAVRYCCYCVNRNSPKLPAICWKMLLSVALSGA